MGDRERNDPPTGGTDSADASKDAPAFFWFRTEYRGLRIFPVGTDRRAVRRRVEATLSGANPVWRAARPAVDPYPTSERPFCVEWASCPLCHHGSADSSKDWIIPSVIGQAIKN